MADAKIDFNLVEVTLLLEALALLEASAKRAAKNVRNPEIVKCHEVTLRNTQALIAKVSK